MLAVLEEALELIVTEMPHKKPDFSEGVAFDYTAEDAEREGRDQIRWNHALIAQKALARLDEMKK